jgi:hypothetical protein
MILRLIRNIVTEEDEAIINFLGCNTAETKVRMDRIDGYSVEDDELVLIINGNEFFFEYDQLIHIQLDNYFSTINTSLQ